MKYTALVISILLALTAACAPVPTPISQVTIAVTTPTYLPSATPTPRATATPPPTVTTTSFPTATATETPKPTPTKAIEVPNFAITRYFMHSNFDDQSNYTKTHPNDKKPYSWYEIVTRDGVQVEIGHIDGPGQAPDGKHRAFIMLGEGTPGFEDFNPGPWGTKFTFRILSGHPRFSSQMDGFNTSIFSAFDVGQNIVEGIQWHPSFMIQIEAHYNGHGGNDNVLVLYGATLDKHTPFEIARSDIPIKDDEEYAMQIIEVPADPSKPNGPAKVFIWNNGQLDPKLSDQRLTDIYRIGVATGTHYFPYAGQDYRGPLTTELKNVDLFQIATQ